MFDIQISGREGFLSRLSSLMWIRGLNLMSMMIRSSMLRCCEAFLGLSDLVAIIGMTLAPRCSI